jgi:hypothetical protein
MNHIMSSVHMEERLLFGPSKSSFAKDVCIARLEGEIYKGRTEIGWPNVTVDKQEMCAICGMRDEYRGCLTKWGLVERRDPWMRT